MSDKKLKKSKKLDIRTLTMVLVLIILWVAFTASTEILMRAAVGRG